MKAIVQNEYGSPDVLELKEIVRPCGHRFVREKLRTFLTKWSNEDLIVLNELIESGKITPVIDTTFPLSEAAEAIRYLEAGHAQGKIVITV